MKDKKGFFFILSIFLILSYIMMSLSVWVKGVETSERAYSEIYKESNLELAVSELTPPKVSYVSDLVMQRAFYDISVYSVSNPVKKGADDELRYVKKAFYEYFINGSPSADNFETLSAPQPRLSSSFGGWIRSLNDSLAGVGVFISAFEVSDFNVWQESADAVNYSTKIKLSMQDKAGTMKLSRDYYINGYVNITGYIDPGIARETGKKGTVVYRRFFFSNDYQQPTDLEPTKTADMQAGQGWFYGYVADLSSNEPLPDEKYRHLYILVGSYDAIINTPNYEQFGAYIVTSAWEQRPTGCANKMSESKTFNAIVYNLPRCEAEIDSSTSTFKPFVVVTSQMSYPSCYNVVEKKDATCALIIAGASPDEVRQNPSKKYQKTGSGVFDIEKVRDFTLCGYYMKSSKAPSYLQRLFKDSYSLNSTYGVETFLTGEYVSGAYNDFDFAQYSALDREMFNSINVGSLVRGLVGCKSEGICASEPSTGTFGISSEALSDYMLEQISCNNGGAGCT